MGYRSEKHKELSEQLTTWWCEQTDYTTKKALAGLLKVHPVTLGDYFSGRKFPKSDIASKLYELTNIICLASMEQPQEIHVTGTSVPLKEERHSGERPGVMAGQPPVELPQKGWRHGERSVVISLQMTSCPFCGHDIARFRRCVNCGQGFVWANVPLEHGEPS